MSKKMHALEDDKWLCNECKHFGGTQPLTGRRVLVVKITASTSEDLAAKRKALNKMIEAKGYGPNVLRRRPKMK